MFHLGYMHIEYVKYNLKISGNILPFKKLQMKNKQIVSTTLCFELHSFNWKIK